MTSFIASVSPRHASQSPGLTRTPVNPVTWDAKKSMSLHP